jgi:hypothetical protein
MQKKNGSMTMNKKESLMRNFKAINDDKVSCYEVQTKEYAAPSNVGAYFQAPTKMVRQQHDALK